MTHVRFLSEGLKSKFDPLTVIAEYWRDLGEIVFFPRAVSRWRNP